MMGGGTRSGELVTYPEMSGGFSPALISDFIRRHEAGERYETARMADEYDHQRNFTIVNYLQMIFSLSGSPIRDFTASNNRIASNFFHRLNTQRVMYSLGNGVSFAGGADGRDETKEALGDDFDELVQDAAYLALIHGVSFVFWNLDRIHVFPLTQFVPVWDESTGALRAGVRYWSLGEGHPTVAVTYEEDGYAKWSRPAGGGDFELVEGKRAYRQTVVTTPADEVPEVVGEDNYGRLPIVPMWGSRLRQSTLVGMRSAIDSYDLIRSGFANDLSDVSQAYWVVENAGGLTDEDLMQIRERMKLTHIVSVPNADDGVAVRPYTQDLPYAARKQYLDDIRAEIYESFGALDVHTVAAGATNDHIDAAYQPMDEEASDFERQVTACLRQVLELAGLDDEPVYKRQRISNQMEQVQMVAMEAQWLDEQTVLTKLPNLDPDEVAEIMRRLEEEDSARIPTVAAPEAEEEDEEGGEAR